jgi:hypothetical protein
MHAWHTAAVSCNLQNDTNADIAAFACYNTIARTAAPQKQGGMRQPSALTASAAVKSMRQRGQAASAEAEVLRPLVLS